MDATNAFLILIAVYFTWFMIEDHIQFKKLTEIGTERNRLLAESNDIRRQTYIERYKPKIRVTPPPWESQEFPTKEQLDRMAEGLKGGQGIGALFGGIKGYK